MARKTITEAQKALLGDQLLTMVAAGQSVAVAARKLEIPERTAHRWYHNELRKVYENNVGLREELLGRELKTLEMLQRPLMVDAMKGDRKAAETVLSIMDRRSKYLGLDQAAKVQLEISRVDETVNKIVQIIDGSVAAVDLERVESLPEAG